MQTTRSQVAWHGVASYRVPAPFANVARKGRAIGCDRQRVFASRETRLMRDARSWNNVTMPAAAAAAAAAAGGAIPYGEGLVIFKLSPQERFVPPRLNEALHQVAWFRVAALGD